MENQPAANSVQNPLARLWPALAVLLLLLFVGFIRLRLLNTPLERDEGEYAYAGQLILQGIPPYELAYNMKLPGTYYAYALGMAVFGETPAGVHLTLLVANSLTMVFVFLLGRKLFGVTAGLVACASYGVMAISPAVLGMAAHANHFVVLFAVPATLLLLRADEDKSAVTSFFSGLLYGLAFLMIQQGISFCLFGCLFLTWRAVMNKSIFSTAFAKSGLIFGVGIFLPFAFFCLSCVIAGNFARFWFWTFTYAREYATIMPWSEGRQHLAEHLEQTRNVSLGLWLLALAGPPLAWLNKATRRQTVFVLVFWLFSFLGTAIGFYFRGHYFILVLPAFAMLVGMAVASLQRILSFSRLKNVLQTLPLILFAAILSWVVYYQSPAFFQLSPLQLCQSLYQWNPFVEAVSVADYIREHSAPDARIAVVGSEPEIYFYAHRHSATGYIYTYALMEPQPAALAMQHEMMEEIEANRPEYLVQVSYALSWLARAHSNRAIFDWFKQYSRRYYEPVGFIHRNSAGEIEAIWGGAANNQDTSNEEFIAVFKRKPDSELTPAKAN
jgi:4-amino-4-deoxy-L-arabinose transferase-like glycosyltransferase